MASKLGTNVPGIWPTIASFIFSFGLLAYFQLRLNAQVGVGKRIWTDGRDP